MSNWGNNLYPNAGSGAILQLMEFTFSEHCSEYVQFCILVYMNICVMCIWTYV
jgi:hypothetical protein